MDYTKVNSNDQLDLIGSCLVGCTGNSVTYTFNLFMFNSVTNTWTPFTNSLYYYTWGPLNSGLAISKNLFTDYPSQLIWKIQLNINVGYSNQTYAGSTSMAIYVNFSPLPGICDINPKNGTTNTLFQITCNGWTDNLGSVAFYSYFGIF